MEKINWGIIGCGDVTEVKSGPAFNKVNNSKLVAVMRRDAEKAKDYAQRHGVPKWYANANDLIADPDINAIYVATPPSSHEEYTLAAIKAGKPVYVEKPMSFSLDSSLNMIRAAEEKNIKLSVAHYRRAQPLYTRIKSLLDEKAIGKPLFANLELYKRPLSDEELKLPGKAWRVDAAVSGGGLFYDLGPHQLDMMYYFFGETSKVSGIAHNQSGVLKVNDIVSGNILFKNGVLFHGIWCFNTPAEEEKDRCEIIGSEGKISFSFFEHQPIVITRSGKTEKLSFDPLPHVQQPMIEKVVDYFLGRGANPCSGEEGVEVMRLISIFDKS